MAREATCLFCRKRFWQKKAEWYCSEECESRAKEAFKKEAHAQSYKESPAVCPVCGKVFMKGLKKKYCSDICRDKSNGVARERQKMKTPESENKEKVKRRGGRKKARTVAEINEAARAEGSSYGEYVFKHGL